MRLSQSKEAETNYQLISDRMYMIFGKSTVPSVFITAIIVILLQFLKTISFDTSDIQDQDTSKLENGKFQVHNLVSMKLLEKYMKFIVKYLSFNPHLVH